MKHNGVNPSEVIAVVGHSPIVLGRSVKSLGCSPTDSNVWT